MSAMVVVPDRPGFGGSTRAKPSCPADIEKGATESRQPEHCAGRASGTDALRRKTHGRTSGQASLSAAFNRVQDVSTPQLVARLGFGVAGRLPRAATSIKLRSYPVEHELVQEVTCVVFDRDGTIHQVTARDTELGLRQVLS